MSYSIHRYSPDELRSGKIFNPPCGEAKLQEAIHTAARANHPEPDAISKIKSQLTLSSLSPKDITNIIDMLAERKAPIYSMYSPDRFLGYGAYKEVFKAFGVGGRPGVIKFTASNNRTEDELLLCRQAWNMGVAEFFLPTRHISLCGYALPKLALLLLNPPWACKVHDTDYIDGLIVQPLAVPLNQYKPGKMVQLHRKFYRIPRHYKDALRMDDDTWLKDAVRVYGKPKVEKFITFAADEGIGDLTPDNLGYLDGRPVILDCLSAAADSC